MGIINRNYFIRRAKKKRDRTEHTSRPSMYFSYSCPRCGDPKSHGPVSKNKLGQPTRSNKLKCQQCHVKIKGN